MKKSKVPSGITAQEINKAMDFLIQNISQTDGTKKEKSKNRKITDDGKHLIFRHEPDPTSPYEYIREGTPLKIKTSLHAIENEIEDSFGGKLFFSYSIKATTEGLFNHFRENFPTFSKSDIEDYAEATEMDFDAAKKKMTLIIARKFIFARIEMAKFLHTELQPTLEIVLGNLIDDAFLYGTRDLGQLVDGTQQFERASKPYINHRKNITKVVRNVGRQKGEKEKVYLKDRELFRKKVLSAMQTIATEGKIQKGKIANEIWSDVKFGKISGGHQKLKRELTKCELDYDELLEEFYGEFNILLSDN